MIINKLTLGGMQTNCYILADDKTGECAVFDPCADCDRILSEIAPYKLKYIILTHMHIDHVMALDELKKATSAPVVAHKNDASVMNDDNFTLAGAFGTVSPISRADITVDDGDFLTLGENNLKIIHTPGHTKGSMCVLCHDILLAGDTLFNQSVGRTDFPGGNHTELIYSIREKLLKLPDDTKVYPGHGPSTTIGYERENNPFF